MPNQPFELDDFDEKQLDIIFNIEQSAHQYPWSKNQILGSIQAGHLCRRLHRSGQTLGFYILMNAVDIIEILDIAVDPTYQSQGFGQLMMKSIEQYSRSQKVDRLHLEVRSSNLVARSFYARVGLVEIGCRKGYYPALEGREDAIIMQKGLI